jgi:hypothetical protein
VEALLAEADVTVKLDSTDVARLVAGSDAQLLCVPRAVAAEDHGSIRAMLASVFKERARVFGELGAPAVVWTDNIL